ncbi:MAG: MarC family protein [Polyangiaceae bacterium]
MTALTFGLLCFSSLFTVLDPLGVAPIFGSMTADIDAVRRRRVLLRACLAALVALTLFAVAGTGLLKLFGVTIEAFRIAGGLLFGLLGLTMLGAVAAPPSAPLPDSDDPSVVPIGIPLIGGPGAMTTVMVLVGQSTSRLHVLAFSVALVTAIVVTGLILAATPALLRRLGPSGVALTTKLMGLIVLVIGVQFVLDGASAVVLRLFNPA